jgi:hypothetical protein
MTARSGRRSALLLTITKGPALGAATTLAAAMLLRLLRGALCEVLYVLANMRSMVPLHKRATTTIGHEANQERLRRTIDGQDARVGKCVAAATAACWWPASKERDVGRVTRRSSRCSVACY